MDNSIFEVRKKLLSHELYGEIQNIDELRIFMNAHVFAVWDFMTLVKRLQNDLTCITLPWQTPAFPNAARLINEIVLYEETDLNYYGEPASHLQMYVDAMKELSADLSMFEKFQQALRNGKDLHDALQDAQVPAYLAAFVSNNINLAIHGSTVEVASSFLYGREDAIPEMFTLLLQRWGINEADVPHLTYYLKRHIHLDSEEHGPAAHKILKDLVADDQETGTRAIHAATKAIADRVSLWDGILNQIRDYRKSSLPSDTTEKISQ